MNFNNVIITLNGISIKYIRIQNILKWLTLLILFIIVTIIPFSEDTGMPFPIQDGQLFFLLTFSLFLAASLIISLINQPNQSFHIRIIDIVITLLGLYISIHCIYSFGLNPPINFAAYISLYVMYLAIRTVKLKHTFSLLIFILIAASIEVINGFLQLLKYLPTNNANFSITGASFNPGPFAGYIAIVFPIALGIRLFLDELNLKHCKKSLYFLTTFYIISTLTLLPFTASRASWISAIVPSLFLLSTKYHLVFRFKDYKKNFLLFSSAFLIITSILFQLYRFKVNSADGRFLIWKISAMMFVNSPVIGYGPERFKANYMEYQAQYFERNTSSQDILIADNIEYAYNEFIQISVELGIIGLLLCLILIALCFWPPDYNKTSFIVRSGFMSGLIFSFFTYSRELWPILINMTLFLGIIGSTSTSVLVKIKAFRRIHNLFLCFTLILFIVLFYKLKQHKESYYLWKKALILYNHDMYDSSIEKFKAAGIKLTNNGLFLGHYGKALMMAEKYYLAKIILYKVLELNCNSIIYITIGDTHTALKEFKLAETCYKKATYMTPNQFYPLYLLANLYHSNNQKQLAIIYAQRVLNKQIKIPSRAIMEMKSEMLKIVKGIKQ